MSQPPDQVLGREDLAKMQIRYHGSIKSKLRYYERINLTGIPIERVTAHALRKMEYPYPAISALLGVSNSTVWRWHNSVSEIIDP